MSECNRSKCCFAILLLFAFTILINQPSYCANIENEIIMSVEIDRVGTFLQEPGNNPVEILRRSGRVINKKWPNKQKKVSFGVFRSKKTKNGVVSIADRLMNKEQLKAYKNLYAKFDGKIKELNVPNSNTKQGFVVKVICDSKVLLKRLKNLVNSPAQLAKLNDKQKNRLKEQIIPLLNLSDYLVSKLTFTSNGLFGKLKLHVVGKQATEIEKLHFVNKPLTVGKYIDKNSMLSICQIHSEGDSKTIVKELRKIPQTKVIEGYLASAGLSLEKDILPYSAKEAIAVLNLEPSGDGGVPDLRLIAPITNYDEKKFNLMLGKLKKLCSQMGIFVKISKDKYAKLNYFLFPQYSVFCGIQGNLLVVTSGKENLLKEMHHIADVDSGKIKSLGIPKNIQFYLLMKFNDFNRQLQMLLQSPLFRNKGIPPISNLTSLDDLVKLEFLVRNDDNSVLLELNIPIKKNKQ